MSTRTIAGVMGALTGMAASLPGGVEAMSGEKTGVDDLFTIYLEAAILTAQGRGATQDAEDHEPSMPDDEMIADLIGIRSGRLIRKGRANALLSRPALRAEVARLCGEETEPAKMSAADVLDALDTWNHNGADDPRDLETVLADLRRQVSS